MSRRLGVIMDPIGSIKPWKDSTFAMLLAAQARGWELWYMEQPDLYLRGDECHGRLQRLRVTDDRHDWFELGEERHEALETLHAVLMRKDPPFNMEYIFTTYLLEQAQRRGVLIVNDPRAIRDANEKLFTAWFPQCCPPNLVTSQAELIRTFLSEQDDIILKPLDTMGGASIFRLRPDDPNVSVVIETLTDNGRRPIMAQRFITEITEGDKRVLVIDGEPVGYALARIPPAGETRGNLAAGGQASGVPLSEHDRWICAQVGPALRERGLLFVGLDIIGKYLTEINVTSPTCIRELDELYDLDIAGDLMSAIEAAL